MASSAIEKYFFKKDTRSLIIVFVSGIAYRYKNVPETIFKEMKRALSKGIFFNRYIKDRYAFEKIEE